MGIKISELEEYTDVIDDDYFPIVDSNNIITKKATKANILSDTTETIEQMQTDISNIWEVIYPVGAVYTSTVETSPETLFGGTWEEINDVFLLSAGSTYTAGNTGGASAVALTTSNLPAHTHSITNYPNVCGDEVEGYGIGTDLIGYKDRIMVNGDGTKTTTTTGSGTAHNNMPPYLVVYVWKRTE